ncbi:hypothetical protein Ahia01_000492100, partial [Argonauta hians]
KDLTENPRLILRPASSPATYRCTRPDGSNNNNNNSNYDDDDDGNNNNNNNNSNDDYHTSDGCDTMPSKAGAGGPPASIEGLQQEVRTKSQQLCQAQHQVEKMRKDKNIMAGLVTQLQREVSDKALSVSQLTREMETLKKDSRKKETNLTQLTTKLSKLSNNNNNNNSNNNNNNDDNDDDDDDRKSMEDHENQKRELCRIHMRLVSTEKELSKKKALVGQLQEEVRALKAGLSKERDDRLQSVADGEKFRSELEDLKVKEKMVRVDLVQAVKKMESFEGRLVQAIFSTPGGGVPKKGLSQDGLIELVKGLSAAQGRANHQVELTKSRLEQHEQQQQEFKLSIRQLETVLQDSVARMKQNSQHSSVLQEELKLLQSVSTDEGLKGLKSQFESRLNGELEWQLKTEKALEDCGVNVTVSTEGTAFIALVDKPWETSRHHGPHGLPREGQTP